MTHSRAVKPGVEHRVHPIEWTMPSSYWRRHESYTLIPLAERQLSAHEMFWLVACAAAHVAFVAYVVARASA